ncbi:hypothetical protein BpHYR1_045473 [Brachionus plicatilis]|uniref:Uncharacterized protein n=1 Tax=Brachionus plicatilis TaxID=10195 RepID=A0A3M7QF02_BRAPC|nr:hypothetical protein BpHYR1_045473 [Brachionus plicatilis]
MNHGSPFMGTIPVLGFKKIKINFGWSVDTLKFTKPENKNFPILRLDPQKHLQGKSCKIQKFSNRSYDGQFLQR